MARSKKRRSDLLLHVTKKKPRSDKSKAIENASQLILYIWRITPEDMRNEYLQQIRADWKDKGRLFFTKKTIMIKALGSNESDEQSVNVSQFSKELTGEGGILFTDEPVDDVLSYFSKTQFEDYARTGAYIDKDIILPAGNLRYHNTDNYVIAFQEQMLKSLGIPVRVDKGYLVLDQDYTICKYGDRLTADQAHMLKLLMFKLAVFKLIPTHYYDKVMNKVIDTVSNEVEEKLVE
ncbi:5804_t:CDS:2 [Funneliformis caledonium]|uniref:5804_t:CDS:1 n=2 Tax=Funneliformis TaxID=1117308 RepID=A0A9N9DLI4_9GLOM|nr:6069_t:CDS:2 [Funneliformis mosseae]CAG8643411.1 5804_t:CDS:2 [Funneliformis caledonium]